MQRLLIAWQILVIALTAVGWGYVIWRFARRPELRSWRLGWLWYGLAGFCLHALVLQSLAYLDAPLKWTAWLDVGGSVVGCVAVARTLRKDRFGRRGVVAREIPSVIAVLAFVSATHLASAIWTGPQRYFGHAHYDHANYVVTAQFLVDEPFSRSSTDIGLRPWLIHPVEKKEERITQSVVHGAVAAVSGGDAQTSFAAVGAVFMAFAGIATFGWLRACGVPRGLAVAGGIMAGVAPGVTRLHLDGFFSQVSTLFVFPALAGVLWARPGCRVSPRLVAAALLSFLIGAYTEVTILAVGVVAGLLVARRASWATRGWDFVLIVGGALALNPGYSLRLPDFLALQYGRARDPLHLATFFPDGGTWAGFARTLFDVSHESFALTLGVALALLLVAGLVLQPSRRLRTLVAIIAAPLAALAALALSSPLPKYPFAKLTIGFTPFWVGLAALAVAALARRGSQSRLVAAGGTALAVGASAVTMIPQYQPLVRPTGALAELTSVGMTRAREEATRHPERRWFVAHDDPLIAQWLCYFGRESVVYVSRRHLGDRIVPSESCEFRRMPPETTELWWLDPGQRGRAPAHEPAPVLAIGGAQESGMTDRGRYYMVGESTQITLTRMAVGQAQRDTWLDFAFASMPGVGPCELEFSDGGGRRQLARMERAGWVRFHVPLAAGRNEFILRIRAKAANPPARLGILQSLSVEPENRQILSRDPVAAPYVD